MEFCLADDVRNEQLAVVGYPIDVNASSILGVLLNSKLDGAPYFHRGVIVKVRM